MAPKESLFFHLSIGILKKVNCLQQICSLSDMNTTTKEQDKVSLIQLYIAGDLSDNKD